MGDSGGGFFILENIDLLLRGRSAMGCSMILDNNICK